MLHLKFALNFSTFFVGSFDIRASQEASPTEGRSPEIRTQGWIIFDPCFLCPESAVDEDI